MGRRPVLAPCRRSRSRTLTPGLTILEVVLAVVMLGLVAAAVTSAISAIETMSARNRRVLAAHEVGNRLILQWLDNHKQMPATSQPIEYGAYSFMWDYEIIPVTMTVNDTQRRVSAATPQAMDRFDLLTVFVHDTEESAHGVRRGESLASISRLYDLTAPRNPESASNITEFIPEIMERASGIGRGPRLRTTTELGGRTTR